MITSCFLNLGPNRNGVILDEFAALIHKGRKWTWMRLGMSFFFFFLLPIKNLLGWLLAALQYIVILAELAFQWRRGRLIKLIMNTLLAFAAFHPPHLYFFFPFQLGSMNRGDEVYNRSLVSHAHRQPLTILFALYVILVCSSLLFILSLELIGKSYRFVGFRGDWSLELCLLGLPGTFGRGEPVRVRIISGGLEGRKTSSEMHSMVIL